MKKFICVLLIISFLTVFLPSCSKDDAAPTCEELIAAYEEAGYYTLHVETTTEDWEYTCYVRVWKDEDKYSEEYVYFHYFETAEQAEAEKEEWEWNIVLYLFSIIYGDPTWVVTKTYKNIHYTYDFADREMLEPFKELIK